MSEEYFVIKVERVTEEMKDGRCILGLSKNAWGEWEWEERFIRPMCYDKEARRWISGNTWVPFAPTHCLTHGIPTNLTTMYEARTKAVEVSGDGLVAEVIILTNEMKSRIPCGATMLVMEKP